MYRENTAPPELHAHLFMNQSRFNAVELVREQIQSHVDAKEGSVQSRDVSSGYAVGLNRSNYPVRNDTLHEKGVGQ